MKFVSRNRETSILRNCIHTLRKQSNTQLHSARSQVNLNMCEPNLPPPNSNFRSYEFLRIKMILAKVKSHSIYLSSCKPLEMRKLIARNPSAMKLQALKLIQNDEIDTRISQPIRKINDFVIKSTISKWPLSDAQSTLSYGNKVLTKFKSMATILSIVVKIKQNKFNYFNQKRHTICESAFVRLFHRLSSVDPRDVRAFFIQYFSASMLFVPL